MPVPSPFGRSREIAELEAALARARAGQGGVFLLSGEAGIGKTRLAEELSQMAEKRDAQVLWGRAWEVDGSSTCWPWIQVLHACTRCDAGAAFLREDPLARDLAPLIPGRAATPDAEGRAVDLFRVAFALLALLGRLSAERPCVLIFDDLHMSDLTSLQLLHAIARGVRDLRVLVLGTYRELEARRVPTTSAQLAKLARHGTARQLERLDQPAVAQWLAASLDAGEELVSAVFGTTEGHPFFVEALSQWLALRGVGASLPRDFELPDGVRGTVRELLARLSSHAREVLEAAAILGRECAARTLELMTKRPMDRVLEAIDEGIEAGLLDARARASSPARFAHILVREAIYQELSTSQRIEGHARALRALLRIHAVDDDACSAELAHHSFEGGPLGTWREAIEFSSRAAHHAMDLFAYDDAAKHCDHALVALERVELEGAATETAALAKDLRRAELLWMLGLCRIRTGQLQDGREACEQAAALAKRKGLRDTFARAVLALGADSALGRVDVRLVALLESALEQRMDDETLRVRVMARLAAAMMPTLHRERPLELAREAVAAARALGDRRLLAEVLSTSRPTFSPQDDLDERIALDRELAMLAQTIGDELLELQAHGRLALDAIERGDPEMVQRELAIHQRLAERARIPQHQLRAACTRLLWATLMASSDDIAAAERDICVLSEECDGELIGLATMEVNRWVRAALRGDGVGQSAASDAMQAHARSPAMAAPLAIFRLSPFDTTGDAARIRQMDEEARARLLEFHSSGPCIGLGVSTLVWGAPVWVRLGERDWIQRTYDALLPYAERVNVGMGPLASLGPIAYTLGRLALHLGHPEEAAAHLRMAIAMCERAGFVEFEAVARRALESAGRSGVSTPARPEATPSLERDGEFWTLRHEGRAVRLNDSKGVRYLEALLREPDRELHVSDLMGHASETESMGDAELFADGLHIVGGGAGDAGPLLDTRAKRSYKQRLEAIDDALAEAESRRAGEAVARLRHEREALAEELARAVGFGGHTRRAGSLSERARVNVQRRIRHVLARVSELDPALGRYLDLHVKTGVFCSWQR